MHAELLVLRLLHVLLGVFWAGAVFFFVLFVEPSIRGAGPDGFKVMLGLKQRRWLDVLPGMGLLVVLTGLRLYWIQSSGFSAAWVHSGAGLSLAIGGLLAIVALGIGLAVVRPTAGKVFALGATLPQLPEGPERAAAMAQLGALRQRSLTATRTAAVLLAITVVTMAIGRYL